MECLPRQAALLLHFLLLQVLVWTKIVGVTHWKLQENSIVPASAAPPSSAAASDGETADDLLWSTVSGEDSEFSVLVKRTTGAGGGGLGAIAGGAAAPGARNCGKKSCPPHRVAPYKQGSSCSSGREGESELGRSSSGRCSTEKKVSAPRNPDGSGPM